jgi:hypothetical protein
MHRDTPHREPAYEQQSKILYNIAKVLSILLSLRRFVMLDYQPNIVLSERDYTIVGKRPIRPDGIAKVTGRATYGADLRLPGMLYGKILRSPYAHARIRSIDTRHAEELPGVYATMTAADLAQPSGKLVDLAEGVQHNMRFLSNNIMAADKVLYKGHAIAAVAATSPHLAEEALALIQVEYEELPPVLTAAEVMQPGAPLLHDRLASLTNINIRPGGLLADDDPTPGSNLANHIEFRLGNIDDCRSTQSQSSLWGAGRRRNVGHSATRRGHQCRVSRHRCPHQSSSTVAGPYPGGPVGERGGDERHGWEVSRCVSSLLPLTATVQRGSQQSR